MKILLKNKEFDKRKGSSIAALKLTPKHTSNTERIALQKYKLSCAHKKNQYKNFIKKKQKRKANLIHSEFFFLQHPVNG
jgi:hypothetical protein